jgi:glycosyltransferase involved in cell wall biosynthesis
MPNPRVSVCVPTYNGATYLAQTLDSIAAQSFEDFEVIIVDDTSTDATLAIAESFAATDPRARVVRNAERAGSSAANANQCLRHARGEWIKFLFQDDLMDPSCLARMVDAGQRGPLVIAWHRYLIAPDVDDTVRRLHESPLSLETCLPTAHASVDEFCDAVLDHWWVNFIGPTSSSLIHRDCFSRYGEFSGDIRTFPDYEYWIRVGNQEGLVIVPERLVTFRVHNTSISAGILNAARGKATLPLEPLLLTLRLARAPDYENIRHRALARQPPIDPERLVRDAAFDARWLAGEVRFRRRDDALLREWNAFCDRHPEARDVLREVDATMSRWGKFKQFVKGRL